MSGAGINQPVASDTSDIVRLGSKDLDAPACDLICPMDLARKLSLLLSGSDVAERLERLRAVLDKAPDHDLPLYTHLESDVLDLGQPRQAHVQESSRR